VRKSGEKLQKNEKKCKAEVLVGLAFCGKGFSQSELLRKAVALPAEFLRTSF